MNWQTVLTIAGLTALVTITLMRTAPRRRRRLALILALPAGFLLYRWAVYRDAWEDLLAALALGAGLVLVWWVVLGRHLPPPRDDTIRVWTKDEPF